MKIVMQEWPKDITVLREVYLVRMDVEGMVKQAQLCFTRKEATDLMRCLNRTIPNSATVLGPYLAQGE